MAVRAAAWPRARIQGWRSGTTQSQAYASVALVGLVALSFTISVMSPSMPLAVYFVWLLLALLLLRFQWLIVVAAIDLVAGLVALSMNAPVLDSRPTAAILFTAAVGLVVYVASRQRSGLPTTLSESLLADLKRRLQAQGRIPPLPEGWESQSAMIASQGVGYAGDFLVADLREGRHLEVILVDVCGKGVGAGPAALQLSGALGGLIGALAPEDLFRAANTFLLRQHDDEAFATAVHLLVDLADGSYQVTSAGHPPALRWDLPSGEWVIDNARGTALGVLPDPELHTSTGKLFPGEALLFYTDGVVEARNSHIDVGIAWLQRAASEAVRSGFGGAARRIIGQVDSGDDDRAVLILSRTPVAAAAEPAS
jgi:hypothetical protein